MGDTADVGLIPRSVRSPVGGNGNSLQYSCPKNQSQTPWMGFPGGSPSRASFLPASRASGLLPLQPSAGPPLSREPWLPCAPLHTPHPEASGEPLFALHEAWVAIRLSQSRTLWDWRCAGGSPERGEDQAPGLGLWFGPCPTSTPSREPSSMLQ